MISTGIFQKAHLSDLKTALSVYANRHQIIADNIANVETAGYRAQEYRFEQYLAGATRRVRGVQTHQNHLSIGQQQIDETTGEIRETRSVYDNGTNNVDIDQEMTSLATNDLSYRLATRLLSMKYTLLRGAIKGQVR